jgi:hypothetical protein
MTGYFFGLGAVGLSPLWEGVDGGFDTGAGFCGCGVGLPDLFDDISDPFHQYSGSIIHR